MEVVKQHRCSFTGGKIISSKLDNIWLGCMNNNEITILSQETGEIIMNITSSGDVSQTLSPLNKVYKNNAKSDEIITFDISLNNNYICFSTKNNFIKIISLHFNSNNIPNNIEVLNEFKSTLKYPIINILFDYTATMIVCGSGNGNILIFNVNSGDITHKYMGGHQLPITCLKFHPNKALYHLYSASNDKVIRYWDLRQDRLVLLDQLPNLKKQLSKTKDKIKKERIENFIKKNERIIEAYGKKVMFGKHKNGINCIEFIWNDTQNIMISVSFGDCICIWDVNKHELVTTVHKDLVCGYVYFLETFVNIFMDILYIYLGNNKYD